MDRRYVEERAFASWSMGFRHVTTRRVADLALDLLERFRITAAD